MSTMNISLTPQLEKLVQDRVESGRYTSASEVIREALRLLENRDRAAELHLKKLQADLYGQSAYLEDSHAALFEAGTAERMRRVGRAKVANSEDSAD